MKALVVIAALVLVLTGCAEQEITTSSAPQPEKFLGHMKLFAMHTDGVPTDPTVQMNLAMKICEAYEHSDHERVINRISADSPANQFIIPVAVKYVCPAHLNAMGGTNVG